MEKQAIDAKQAVYLLISKENYELAEKIKMSDEAMIEAFKLYSTSLPIIKSIFKYQLQYLKLNPGHCDKWYDTITDELLKHPDISIQVLLCKFLKNLLRDFGISENMLHKKDYIQFLIEDMNANISDEKRAHNANFLRFCCRQIKEGSDECILLVETLVSHITASAGISLTTLSYCMWGLHHLSLSPVQGDRYALRRLASDPQAIRALVNLIPYPTEVSVAVIFALGSCVCSRNEELCDTIFSTNVLELLGDVLVQTEPCDSAIKMGIYWIYLNAAEKKEKIAHVLPISSLVRDLRDSCFDVTAQTLCIASFVVKESESAAVRLVEEFGIISAICELLKNPNTEKSVCIETIEDLLVIGKKIAEQKETHLYNPYALIAAECGILELLNDESSRQLVSEYFGIEYEEFLTRKRGLKIKSAYK